MSVTITGPQLRALQSLAARCFSNDGDPRAARLAWVSQQLGRPVASFKELRADEGARLIETLKTRLGQPLTPRRRRPHTRDAAMAAGTHGRKNITVTVPILAGPDDLARVDRMRAAIGMSVEGFEGWLRSRSSPIGPRSEARIYTVAEANRIYWALKSMARRAG